jgi:hypothetical protein
MVDFKAGDTLEVLAVNDLSRNEAEGARSIAPHGLVT